MKRPHSLVAALALAGCGSSTQPPPPADVVDVSAHVHDAVSPDVAPSDVTDARPMSDVASRCVNGVALPYPDAPARIDELRPLPDLRFDTAAGVAALHDFYAPCATAPQVLLIRTLTSWSGPSQHAAAHTQRLLAHPQADRVALLDLLALGPDNLPATRDDLTAWRARYDAAPTALAIDPQYRFNPLYLSVGELPLYVFVDTRSMRVARVLTRPSSAELEAAITAALASIDGLPRPRTPPAEPLVDGRFTRDEWEMIQAMAPLPAVPADPTNRVADDTRAARLGESLFNDAGLSSSSTVSCATCHAAATLFTDARPQGVGVRPGDRNTPTVLFAPHARWSFWDGRADTLWAQALGPVENPAEMASTRLAVAHRIADRYAAAYTELFGPLPPLGDATRFPAAGMPGDPRWETMTSDDRDAVNRVFVNMGKSMAAFERTLSYAPSALDRYAAGAMTALTVSQRDGLKHFFVGGCVQCHHGPLLSDGAFHNIGFATGRTDGMPDRGRIDAIAALMASPFRSDGAYSDDRTVGAHLTRIVSDPSQLGQFHTPSLRGVARTGPWGHGGTFPSLAEVIRHYARGLSMPPLEGSAGTRDLHLPSFHQDDGTVLPMVNLLNAM